YPAFDGHGNAFLAVNSNGVELYKSIDHGDQWGAPVNAVTNLDNMGDFVDRPFIVADSTAGPRDGTLYISYESFFTNPVGWVFVKSSHDGGVTWDSPTRVDDSANPATQDPRNNPAVGADGTVYVVYASGEAGFIVPQEPQLPTSFVVASSHD